MAANAFRPPKQWSLTENETVTSFANWQSNLLYHLSLCDEFASFLDSVWAAKPAANRGLQDDAADAVNRKTAAQKAIILERMLGLIAQFAPSLLRKDVIKCSTSLSWIWQRIRRHYGFVQSETNFLKLCEIKRKDDERYETFYQRILAHLDDNLLTVGSNLQHNGVPVAEDETMSPTTERLAVYLWLSLIDERLPSYVARVYAHDLASKSLKDVQPQLSQSMDALLTELSTQSEVQIHYARSAYNNKRQIPKPPQKPSRSGKQPSKTCSLCKASNRPYQGHDIASCWFLSKFEKMEIVKALRVTTLPSDDELFDDDEIVPTEPVCPDATISQCVSDASNILSENSVVLPPGHSTGSVATVTMCHTVQRVECDISPFFYAFLNHHVVHIVVDTGATSSVVSRSFLLSVGISPKDTQHSAHGADKSKLNISGEIQIHGLTFGGKELPLTALVMDKLDCDILAGTPFCKANDIHVHLKSEKITIGDVTIPYGAGRSVSSKESSVRQVNSYIVRNDTPKVLLPGEFVEITDSSLSNFDVEVAIKPRPDFPHPEVWPLPSISRVIQGTVRIPNIGHEPIRL